MGSSTVKLQNIVDFISTMGELSPVLPAGGYTTLPAITNATDVMKDLLAKPFNWKWNSINLAPFYTISWQNDYFGINIANIGWLESCVAVDINNTALPPPMFFPEAVRKVERGSWASSPPEEVCWLYNRQLYAGAWPGNSKIYTNPLGAPQTPSNAPTCIVDTNGNMLTLTTYGVTAAAGAAPVAPLNAVAGVTVQDGTCVWTVCNPNGQGFRVGPLPPQQGVVYQMNLVAQMKPPSFNTMQQTIDPIPDEYQGYFRDGMIAYTYRIATDPAIRAQFPAMRQMWLASMMDACKQGDRERDAARFIPESSIMGSDIFGNASMGPADPYNWAQRRGN